MAGLFENYLLRCRQACERMSLWQRRVWGLAAVYLAVYLLIDAQAVTHFYLVTPLNNLNVAEAQAWLAGRLDLDVEAVHGRRPWDSALRDGRVYSAFPPMFTLVSAAVMAVVPDGVPNVVLILLLLLPMPGLAYALFLRRTETVWLAVLLSWGYLLGSSMLPLMDRGLRNGEVWFVNHLLSQLGLLIFLLDYFGRRRVWLGGIGLIVAVWSRQLTVLYLVPLALAAIVGRVRRPDESVLSGLPTRPTDLLSGLRTRPTDCGDALLPDEQPRRRRLVSLAVVMVVVAALPAVLNMLKFGHPLESGYRFIYEGRWDDPDDWAAQSAAHGLFALRFIPRNLYYMNLGLPLLDSPLWLVRFVPNAYGTGIWWTTPLLLCLLADWRRVWASVEVRWLLVAAAGVFALLMSYHTTGRAQLGFNRFSMDFMIVLLAAIAPHVGGPVRKWVTLAFVLWGVWYFRWAI